MTDHTIDTDSELRTLIDDLAIDPATGYIRISLTDLKHRISEYRFKALKAAELRDRIESLNETRVSLRAFINGTSTNPAADELLEIEDRLAALKDQEATDDRP